jgi:hypothetical protein
MAVGQCACPSKTSHGAQGGWNSNVDRLLASARTPSFCLQTVLTTEEPLLVIVTTGAYLYGQASQLADSMALPLPAKLKATADITRFAQRAAQLEKLKPAIAYWCKSSLPFLLRLPISNDSRQVNTGS